MSDFKKFIEDLKAASSIAEIIKEHQPLKQKHAGKYVGKCPFHKDDTPSFSVDDTSGFFYCFGCLEKGDVIGFLQKIYNISFNEAVERLASKYNMPVPTFSRQDAETAQRQKSQKEQILIALNLAADASRQNLYNTASGKGAVAYLKSRGFTEETITFFEFGLFDKSFDKKLSELLKLNDIEDDILQQGGIYIKNDEGLYNRFNGRITVPIKNKNGKTVGFGGRIYTAQQQQANLAKYINSPETPVFKKNEVLFNYNNAITQKSDYLLVVEGYFDVIKLWQSGFKNAVAPMGTNITEGHIQNLTKTGRKILFCFDGDSAGKSASFRAATMCFKYLADDNYFGFVSLPAEVKDPDEMIDKYGLEAFLNCVNNNLSIQKLFIDTLLKQHDIIKPQEKTALEAKVKSLCIDVLTSKNLAKNFANFFYETIKNVEFASKYKSKNKRVNLAKQLGFSVVMSEDFAVQSKIFLDKLEINLLKLLVSNCHLISNNYDDLLEMFNLNFTNAKNEQVFEQICELLCSEWQDAAGVKSLLSQFYDAGFEKPNYQQLVATICNLLKQHNIRTLEELLHSTVKNNDGSEAQLQLTKQISKQIAELKVVK